MSIFGYRCRAPHQKPFITVWAEARGNHEMAEADWSFGCATRGVAHVHNGYPMMCGGRITRMALSVVTRDGNSPYEAIVSLLIDGKIPGQNFIRKHPGEKVATIAINPPIEVAAGSVINFISRKDCVAKSSIVSLLIELDM